MLYSPCCFQVSKAGRGRAGRLGVTQHTRQTRLPAPGPGLSRLSLAFPFSHQVFHCVHFECPEQQSKQKEDSSEEPGTGDLSTPSQQLDPRAPRAPSASSLPPSPGPNSRSPNQQNQ